MIDKDDPYYVLAYKTWSEILCSDTKVIISNYVLAETYTLLRYKLPQQISEEYVNVIENSITSGRIILKMTNSKIEKQTEELLLKYKEHELSYTDASSFIFIKNLKIKKVFTFDSHFNLAETEIIPIRY